MDRAHVQLLIERSIKAAPAFFFTLLCVYTALFHFRAPFFDHWDIVPYFENAKDGTLALQHIFSRHGGHWHATGYVIMLATGWVTGMAHWADPAVSLLLSALGFWALARMVRRSAEALGAKERIPLLLACSAFFYFSLDQIINFLWGWQVALIAAVAGVLWAFELLSRPGGVKIIHVMLAAAAASFGVFGFATALCVLPVGALLILADPDNSWRKKSAAIALWSVFSLGVIVLFLQGAPTYRSQMAPSAGFFETIFGLAHYSANYAAGGLAKIWRPVGPFLSLLGLMAMVVLIWRQFRIGGVRWLLDGRALWALVALSLAASLLTGLGRWAEFGAGQAYAGRYVTFSNFAWLGLSCLVIIALPNWPDVWRRVTVAVLSVLVLAKSVNAGGTAISMAEHAVTVNAAADRIAADYPDFDPADLALLHAPHQAVEDDLAILHEYRVSLFRRDE